MGYKQMVKFLNATYAAKDYMVPCLIGGVGIGKTAAVNEHAKNVGANKVVEIILSQILPTEISGFKMPDKLSKKIRVFDDARLNSLEDGDILFFDELLEADQAVLSACLTLIESRTMLSGKKLPNIQIIAATNETISPGMLKPSIRQRFIFHDVCYDKAEISDFIFNETGVRVKGHTLNLLEEDSSQYNILSPRSLTKMVKWLCTGETNDDRKYISACINDMYDSRIGSYILDDYYDTMTEKYGKTYKFKLAIDEIINDYINESDKDSLMKEIGLSVNSIVDIEDIDLSTLLEHLQKTPQWDAIKKDLENQDINEVSF